jgi:hypothetical protein
MYKEIAIGFIIVLAFVFGILPLTFNFLFRDKKEPEDENFDFDGDFIPPQKATETHNIYGKPEDVE